MKRITHEPVKVKGIQSNKLLSLSVVASEVELCMNYYREYGQLPSIVVRKLSHAHEILHGEAEVQALRKLRVDTAQVCVITGCDDTEARKITLMLIAMRTAPGVLQEGLILAEMLEDPTVDQSAAATIFGKSISWVSRRLKVARDLTPAVKDLLQRGQLCLRTAQEIAKLPSECQHRFALNVIRDGLPKSAVEKLVGVYRSRGVSEALRQHILSAPRDVLSRAALDIKRIAKQEDRVVDPKYKLQSAFDLLEKLFLEIEQLIASLSAEEIAGCRSLLQQGYQSAQQICLITKPRFAPGQERTARSAATQAEGRDAVMDSTDETAVCPGANQR